MIGEFLFIFAAMMIVLVFVCVVALLITVLIIAVEESELCDLLADKLSHFINRRLK